MIGYSDCRKKKIKKIISRRNNITHTNSISGRNNTKLGLNGSRRHAEVNSKKKIISRRNNITRRNSISGRNNTNLGWNGCRGHVEVISGKKYFLVGITLPVGIALPVGITLN